ncbi:MAG TPA: GWxTD domain-containing protein, partial [Candidatus Eisenbacteria bacterium]|nr:GWxTD domain-containing protein [Candidatus Eisenbacteria bacterium]
MRRFRPGQVLAACLLLALARGAVAAPPPPGSLGGDPSTSVGDIRFHARATAFRHGPSEARAEFAIRVPYREIKFVPKADSLFEGRLRITVEMWDATQKRAGYQQREAQVQVTDPSVGADSLLGEIYKLGLTARPGKYRFRVLVEDMNVARMGLVYKMKNQKQQGKVEGVVDMGAWLFAKPALSGIETAWEILAARPESAFRKGPYEVNPHPSAYYGLFKDEVAGYYEIYDDPPPPEGRSYRVRSFVVSAKGDTIPTGDDSLRVTEGTAWPHAISIDVSMLAAGHYRLLLELRREGERAVVPRATDFDVLWAEDSWRPEATDFYDVTARVLLTSEEVADFRQLSMGDKETRIEEAWRDADPSPETAENEARTEFLRRIAYANTHYTIFTQGMFSDRGRVYIQYGEPDEWRIERLPIGEKTLAYALGNTIPQQQKDVLTKSNSGVADVRPYEIWTYDKPGSEAKHKHGLNQLTSGMKFVFID